MWRRPALLVLYLAVLVVVTWIVELGFWWDTGYASYQIVNPLRNLSVSQIRTLLEMRGIPYAAFLEKSEIVNLLQQSGSVQYGEIFGKELIPESHSPLEIFGKEEFYEQVYDENESLWLIEVVPGEGQYAGHRVLDDRAWHTLVPKLQVLQVSSAVVSCQYDRRFCAKQGWSHPQLVLILPPSQQANKLTTGRNPGRLPGREHIVFTSTTHLTVLSVLTWLYGHILSRVDVLQEVKQLEDTWLNVAKVDKEKVPRVVYISELLSPPLLIATLGLRLSTRIKLASFTVRKEEKEQVSRLLKKSGLSVPSIAVVTSEGVTSYGGRKGEPLTRPALNSYICTLQPHMNDAFLVSLIMANLLAVADFFYFLDFQIRAWNIFTHFCEIFLFIILIVFLLWLAGDSIF
nr:uncharacterized protein LOC128697002 [Cherax quadricarinatus]